MIEQELISHLKGIGKGTIQFIDVQDYNSVHGLYIYRKKINVLKGGMDIYFDELSQEDKNTVEHIVKSNRWKINNTLQ